MLEAKAKPSRLSQKFWPQVQSGCDALTSLLMDWIKYINKPNKQNAPLKLQPYGNIQICLSSVVVQISGGLKTKKKLKPGWNGHVSISSSTGKVSQKSYIAEWACWLAGKSNDCQTGRMSILRSYTQLRDKEIVA